MTSDTYITLQLRDSISQAIGLANGIPQLRGVLEGIQMSLDEPMQLAVIGRVSSSKSTFVNALLGEEVVQMGKMVTTYNVCHLKYGNTNTPITVVFKNGQRSSVAREKLSEWANSCGKDLKKDVQYLEISYPNDFLKRINIIDTPGLDSAMNDDSRNTIDYLEKVRPDAIIMLFTHGAIAKDTLDTVKQYVGDTHRKLDISPLNAIGLYTKIDDNWNVSYISCNPLTIAKQTISESIYGLFPDVRETLYSIFPICARLGLAASIKKETDWLMFEKLLSLPENTFRRMLISDGLFVNNAYESETGLSSQERASLLEKYGRYGIYSIVDSIRNNKLNRNNATEWMEDISGLSLVKKRLMTHFGERSVLIKSHNLIKQVGEACSDERKRNHDNIDSINQIERCLLRTMMNIKEYKELDYLSRLYNGVSDELDSNAVDEFKQVCGESEAGQSVAKRLGVGKETSIEQMKELISKRMAAANQKANLNMVLSPKNAELYLMLTQSYKQLFERIEEMVRKKNDAERVIRVANDFFYGD